MFAPTTWTVLPALVVVFLAASSFVESSRCPRLNAIKAQVPIKPPPTGRTVKPSQCSRFYAVFSPSPIKPPSGIKGSTVIGEPYPSVKGYKTTAKPHPSVKGDITTGEPPPGGHGSPGGTGEPHPGVKGDKTTGEPPPGGYGSPGGTGEPPPGVKGDKTTGEPPPGGHGSPGGTEKPEEDTWSQYEGMEYKIFNSDEEVDWFKARELCKSKGADLAYGMDDDYAILELLQEKYKKMGLDTFDLGESWVGLHKEAGGKWRFVDGQRAIKYGFAKNEELEECASAELGVYEGEEIFLIPGPCDTTRQLYVCERKIM